MKEEALKYLKAGASVIPVGEDKIPMILWKIYQERLPTKQEVEKWWTDFPKANIGIITGKISNLIVVDVEKGGDITPFPETDTIQTGGGGWHLYYAYTPFENKTRIFPLTDIRGDGGYVVAPPSTHKSGEKYKLIKHIGRTAFPKDLFEGKIKHTISEWKEKATLPISEGSRNNDFTSIVGGLLNKFPQDDWEGVVWSLVKDKNSVQERPLEERELRTIFNSISSKELKRRNTGGEIKDIQTSIVDEEIRVDVTLAQAVVCFKVKNIIGNLLEATVITWIQKNTGLSHEMPFYLKIRSDSNKEQWVRILGKAFDKKEDKEVYPWTILVTKVNSEIEKKIREHVQDFSAVGAVAKEVTWMLEPFIQEDQINTFFGLGSSGKTMLSMFFAAKIAQDKDYTTLLIDYENDLSSWVDKLRKSIGTQQKQDNFIYFDSEQIPLAEQVDKIKEVIKRRNIKLVIVDSASLASGDSTTDEKAALRLISALKLLRTTIVLIAHQRKNDGDRTPIGSIQYENQARNVWNFKSSPDDVDETTLHIACKHTKANNTWLRKDPIGYKITFGDTIEIYKEDAISYFEDKFPTVDRIQALLKEERGLDYKEIAEKLGINPRVAQNNLTKGKIKLLFMNDDSGRWSLI